MGYPITHWSHRYLAEHLTAAGMPVSPRHVGRILDAKELQPHRQRMWLTSQDADFRAKRDDVLHVYYDTPPTEHIICIDEKPSIQALERRHPDLPMAPGMPVRREFEYVRHGTLTLMGAYDVRRGWLFGYLAERRGSDRTVELLDVIDAFYPEGRGHIVCDNLTDHCTDDVVAWFEEHPRWTQHFTPTHASWLNQIEAKFAQLEREVLRRGSFTSTTELRQKVEAWMLWECGRATPFHWTYRPKSWDQIPDQT